MDLDEEIKSREEGEIGSESREKGDLFPCSSPLLVILFRPPYFMLNFLYEIKEIVGRALVTFHP